MVMFFTTCEYKGRIYWEFKPYTTYLNSDQSYFVGVFFDNEYDNIKFMILILNVILVWIMSMLMGILSTIARLVMVGDTLRDLSYCVPHSSWLFLRDILSVMYPAWLILCGAHCVTNP